MRTLLDRLYLGSGVLAGLFIIAIVVLIMAQIIGRWFSIIVPSTEDFSGYFLAASSFLALAYTLREGGHIRVNIIIRNLTGKTRIWQERAVLSGGLALAIFMAYWLTHMVWESWSFNEMSRGYIAVPLWIPQIPVALGAIIFAIALLDELIYSLRHGMPEYTRHDDELEEINNMAQQDSHDAESK